MAEKEYTSADAVNFAMSGNSGEFKNAVNKLMADRVAQAVELKRVDVAANFMKTQEVEPEVTVEPEVATAEPVEEPTDATTEVQ
ncbi:MAG: hypothetical protein CMO44_07105 [Verrucomicrobiales bacterium]|jgi:hypothetical protein|nr:hypothetical protein [Verrucomicrobiales bacterium]|tara:strand:- start:236 stop:487 length:252 start_codon:yes stop_codon:yes gene_type:complete